MTETVRVEREPAWLLHQRPFRDSSRILELLTENHGRLSVVARGSRSAKSPLRGILRPFTPLAIGWVARRDLGTLTGAELQRRPVALSGDALLCGYYVNELLIHLLHRHDPHPELYRTYSAVLPALAVAEQVAPVLRHFEMDLLRLAGYELSFEVAAERHAMPDPQRSYEYRVQQGPVAIGRQEGPMIFSGAELRAIAARDFGSDAVLRAASRLLRGVIAFHLDGRELKSRKVLMDIRRSGAGRGNV